MDTKSKTELIAIINKQEEYIGWLIGMQVYESMNVHQKADYHKKGQILREQIEALKN